MIQLTFLLEGYSTLCPDWFSAYEQALEYVEYKANSVVGDRVNAYMKDLVDLQYMIENIVFPASHASIVGKTVRFDWTDLGKGRVT